MLWPDNHITPYKESVIQNDTLSMCPKSISRKIELEMIFAIEWSRSSCIGEEQDTGLNVCDGGHGCWQA
jgi:hypothetical protein